MNAIALLQIIPQRDIIIKLVRILSILFLKLKVSFIFTIDDNIYHHIEDKNKLESFSW